MKEDILCRFGELGISVVDGKIQFCPRLLRREEFLHTPADFHYFDHSGNKRRIRLPANSLAFTYCQTPVIYRIGNDDSVNVLFNDESRLRGGSRHLDAETSRLIFGRTGGVERIIVSLPHRKFVSSRHIRALYTDLSIGKS